MIFSIQAYEKAKIERIKERTEECAKIYCRCKSTKTFSCTRGKIKALSTKEAITSVKSLAKDFSKITTGIKNDAVFVKTLDKP